MANFNCRAACRWVEFRTRTARQGTVYDFDEVIKLEAQIDSALCTIQGAASDIFRAIRWCVATSYCSAKTCNPHYRTVAGGQVSRELLDLSDRSRLRSRLESNRAPQTPCDIYRIWEHLQLAESSHDFLAFSVPGPELMLHVQSKVSHKKPGHLSSSRIYFLVENFNSTPPRIQAVTKTPTILANTINGLRRLATKG